MTSVNKINHAIAAVRGMPIGTVEAYSRNLRQNGSLPQTKRGSGATPLTPIHASLMIAAVMRGSPLNAAENAKEVGELVAHSPNGGGALMEPVLQRTLEAFGWPDGVTFSEAVAWLLDRVVDATIFQYLDETKGFEIQIDRYWPVARFFLNPTAQIAEKYVAGYREAFPNMKDVDRLCERNLDGTLRHPMVIEFASPLLHEMKVSYGIDKDTNRRASSKFLEIRSQRSEFDLHGFESVTHRTVYALAELFRPVAEFSGGKS